jgi:triosephosphate isomerase
VRVLKCRSFKATKARDTITQADVDGALDGGASLDAVEFTAICAAAAGTRSVVRR